MLEVETYGLTKEQRDTVIERIRQIQKQQPWLGKLAGELNPALNVFCMDIKSIIPTQHQFESVWDLYCKLKDWNACIINNREFGCDYKFDVVFLIQLLKYVLKLLKKKNVKVSVINCDNSLPDVRISDIYGRNIFDVTFGYVSFDTTIFSKSDIWFIVQMLSKGKIAKKYTGS